MSVKNLGRMASNLPEISDATDKWDMDATRAHFDAKLISEKNRRAADWAKDNGGTLPFRRGVLVQLRDGSAIEVTREHMNQLVAINRHSLTFRKGVAPREPFRFWDVGDDLREPFMQIEDVLAYPVELYGCPVIAIGLRKPGES